MFDEVVDFLCDCADAVGEFVSDHPLLTIALLIVLFFGGCSVAVHLHIVSSSTKLMPY